MTTPYVVPSTTRRDLLVGLGSALVLLALVLFAVMNMSGGVAGSTLNGQIVAKNFTPLKEEQVTFGRGGVHSRERDGEYVLECNVAGHRYLVTVDKKTYNSKQVGEHFLFTRPGI